MISGEAGITVNSSGSSAEELGAESLGERDLCQGSLSPLMWMQPQQVPFPAYVTWPNWGVVQTTEH